MPISATPMVPMVPHEVPVASEVIAQISMAAMKKILGLRIFKP